MDPSRSIFTAPLQPFGISHYSNFPPKEQKDLRLLFEEAIHLKNNGFYEEAIKTFIEGNHLDPQRERDFLPPEDSLIVIPEIQAILKNWNG